jgi:hypothetical protein
MRTTGTLAMYVAAVALPLVPVHFAAAEESRFDVGIRGVVILSRGEPSNDMTGVGLVARWQFRPAWHVGVALDSVTFDYETPNRVLGIPSIEVIDPTNDFSRVSFLVERRYSQPGRAWDWFWTAGIGVASIHVGLNAAGTTPVGNTFDIETTADDEVHVFAGGGLRRTFNDHWAFESGLTVQHHDTDYRLVDRVSGSTGAIGSHTPYGLSLGFSYRF